jgi:geranylgeranyl transferase type-2 subunit beta
MSDAVPYLGQLTSRLAEGLSRLPKPSLNTHAAYLRALQNPDGGFSGREGGSDLYYTGFALRGLAVLDALSPEVCERATHFLRQCLHQQASVVDFFSLLYACLLIQMQGGPDVLAESPADWPDRVATLLESYRAPDGGYAKTAAGPSGSTYHTFLVALCYQLLNRPVPSPESIVRFLASRRREDGGYVEIAPMKRGGTNPTAAGVGVHQILAAQAGDNPKQTDDAVAIFLAAMQNAEGGFQANARSPLADLLSTFTAMWTLDRLDGLERIDQPAALEFVHTLELATGGFRGGLWDDRADVEYTFYGLGAAALLSRITS